MRRMLWAVLVFVLTGVAGIVVLGVFGWRLWQQVRSLLRKVTAAEQRISVLTEALAAAQEQRPDGRRTNDW
jgi:predicted PurR-regulated permease PerM